MSRLLLNTAIVLLLLATIAEAQSRCKRFTSTDYVDQAAFDLAVTEFCSRRPSGKECCTIGVDDNTVDVANSCNLDLTKLDYFQICEGSCRGSSACNDIADTVTAPNSVRISILPDSCTGANACGLIGFSSTRLKQVKVKEGSCNGLNACVGIAFASAKNVVIGKSSCSGSLACANIARDNGRRVIVGDNTCANPGACSSMAYDFATVVLLGDSTCPSGCDGCCESDMIQKVEILMGSECPCVSTSSGSASASF